MKCKICDFDNEGVEFMKYDELVEIELDGEDELKCEFCGANLIPQILGGA